MPKATSKLKKKGSVLGTTESVTKRFFFLMPKANPRTEKKGKCLGRTESVSEK